MRDKTMNESDLKFLDEGRCFLLLVFLLKFFFFKGDVVKVDETLFQDLDDLDLDDDDEDFRIDDESFNSDSSVD